MSGRKRFKPELHARYSVNCPCCSSQLDWDLNNVFYDKFLLFSCGACEKVFKLVLVETEPNPEWIQELREEKGRQKGGK